MNIDSISKINIDKNKNLLDGIILNNGTISIRDINNACEVFGDYFNVKVEFPIKTFKMNLKTLFNMKENGFKTNFGVHELNIDTIIRIYLDKKEYKNFMYFYENNS